MRQPNEIKNVRPIAGTAAKSKSVLFWENLQLLGLALTIFGQIAIGASYLLGQGVWLVANIIAVARDFILRRPAADKIKNIALTGITAGLITINCLGVFA